jgi:hypothetical protein
LGNADLTPFYNCHRLPTRSQTTTNKGTMKNIDVRNALAPLAAVFFAFCLVGCSTTTVIDRTFPSATTYSRAEAMGVLKEAVKKANALVEMDEVGFSCNEKMGYFGIPSPFHHKVIFTDVTKITSIKGAQGDAIVIYGEGDKRMMAVITGRDDAYNDQVASALLVLCPNIK